MYIPYTCYRDYDEVKIKWMINFKKKNHVYDKLEKAE